MFVKPKGFKSSDNGFSQVNPLGLYTWRHRYYHTGEMSKKISPSGRELRFYYNYGFLLNEEGWFARSSAAEDGYQLPAGSENHKITHIVTWIYGPEESPLGIDTTPANAGPNEKCINYYLTDENNSIIALCDGFGGIIKVYEYDSEGKRREVSSDTPQSNPHTGYNPLGFKGSHSDIDTAVAMDKFDSRRIGDGSTVRVEEFEKMMRYYRIITEREWEREWIRLHGLYAFLKRKPYICYHHTYLYSSEHFVKFAYNHGFHVTPIPVVFWEETSGLHGHYGVFMIVEDLTRPGGPFFAFTDANRWPLGTETYIALQSIKYLLLFMINATNYSQTSGKTVREDAGDSAGKDFTNWVDNISRGIK